MSFTLDIKNEILNQRFDHKESLLELLKGIVISSAIIENNFYVIKIMNTSIRMRLLFVASQFDLKIGASKEKDDVLLIDQKLFNDAQKINKPEHYFAGVFLARGSINSLFSSSNHLELMIHEENNAQFLLNYLNTHFEFEFKLIKRKHNFHIYIKRTEWIEDFLKLIKVYNALQTYYDRKADKDINAISSKQANLDYLNSTRIVKASEAHIKMYQFIKANHLEHKFSVEQLLFFSIKEQEPFQSLEYISEMMFEEGVEITRSGLHHWIRKLKKVYDENQ